jgi:hypothetical protein
MLDYFCIFTKGGALLWAFSFTALKGDPVNSLVRNGLLEERSGEASYTYTIPTGGAYTLKWRLNNVRVPRLLAWWQTSCACTLGVRLVSGSLPVTLCCKLVSSHRHVCPQALGLVFVAVYQKAFKLLYVEDLLERVNRAFTPRFKPDCYAYTEFDALYQKLVKECEQRAEAAKRPTHVAPIQQQELHHKTLQDGGRDSKERAEEGDPTKRAAVVTAKVSALGINGANGNASAQSLATSDDASRDSDEVSLLWTKFVHAMRVCGV